MEAGREGGGRKQDSSDGGREEGKRGAWMHEGTVERRDGGWQVSRAEGGQARRVEGRRLNSEHCQGQRMIGTIPCETLRG